MLKKESGKKGNTIQQRILGYVVLNSIIVNMCKQKTRDDREKKLCNGENGRSYFQARVFQDAFVIKVYHLQNYFHVNVLK